MDRQRYNKLLPIGNNDAKPIIQLGVNNPNNPNNPNIR